MKLRFLTLILLPLAMSACSSLQSKDGGSVSSEPWGAAHGQKVDLYTLTNKNGMVARITNYGGIIVSLAAPDRTGQFADVVLGFDSLDRYVAKNPFFGALTGRYANRIGGAAFTLDGQTYKLAANNGKNHIHGGKVGFDKKVWSASKTTRSNAVGVEMKYTSPAGEEGYPGTLDCVVTYWLRNNENALEIEYRAVTDAPTIVNLTNHSYFNLAGEGSGSVLGHEIMIDADRFTPTDSALIPTGEIESVFGTPLDFTTSQRIGARIDEDYEPLRFGQGYDHNYVLNGSGLRTAARVRDPKSGRVMEVRTTEPGVQLYTANHTNTTGKGGKAYKPRSALCLETQHFPDSPNKPRFPSVTLRPGDTYQQTTIYEFSIK